MTSDVDLFIQRKRQTGTYIWCKKLKATLHWRDCAERHRRKRMIRSFGRKLEAFGTTQDKLCRTCELGKSRAARMAKEGMRHKAAAVQRRLNAAKKRLKQARKKALGGARRNGSKPGKPARRGDRGPAVRAVRPGKRRGAVVPARRRAAKPGARRRAR